MSLADYPTACLLVIPASGPRMSYLQALNDVGLFDDIFVANDDQEAIKYFRTEKYIDFLVFYWPTAHQGDGNEIFLNLSHGMAIHRDRQTPTLIIFPYRVRGIDPDKITMELFRFALAAHILVEPNEPEKIPELRDFLQSVKKAEAFHFEDRLN